jgi:adenylylsulfate kinase
MSSNNNIHWHDESVSRDMRYSVNKNKSCILWFTGLSGSGKSTLANAVNLELFKRKIGSHLLDGDNIRHGLCKDLGFSDQDRCENIRRIGEVSKLFMDAGMIILTAFVSPFQEDRQQVRELVDVNDFIGIK